MHPRKFSHATNQVLFKQTKRQTTKKLQGTRQHIHLRISQALCWRAIPQPWKPRLDSAKNTKSFPLPHPESLIPQSGKCCWELKWWTSSATSHPACINSWSFSASQIFFPSADCTHLLRFILKAKQPQFQTSLGLLPTSGFAESILEVMRSLYHSPHILRAVLKAEQWVNIAGNRAREVSVGREELGSSLWCRISLFLGSLQMLRLSSQSL